MGLLSIFKRDRQDAASPDPSPASSPTVQQARARARRRLIGATLLVLMAIVGFPMLFESQPRPIPVDIPIDIPRAETAPPLSIPPLAPASRKGTQASRKVSKSIFRLATRRISYNKEASGGSPGRL